MTTIDVLVRELNRKLSPQFEEMLRAELAGRDREWLIDQIVRLTLDAHRLQEIDRQSEREAKARARAERIERLRALALDRAALARFLAEHEGTTRESLLASGLLLDSAPAKGTAAITAGHRSPEGEALLERRARIDCSDGLGDRARIEHAGGDGLDELVLVREDAEDRAFGDARCVRDLARRDARTVLEQERQRGRDDRGASLLGR